MANPFQVRFVYSRHKSLERAQMALDDYFATGEVSLSEFPQIKPVNTPAGKRWIVEIDG